MGVDVLKAPCKFVIEAIYKTDDGAANADDSFLRSRGTFNQFIVILGYLLDGVVGICCDDGD